MEKRRIARDVDSPVAGGVLVSQPLENSTPIKSRAQGRDWVTEHA